MTAHVVGVCLSEAKGMSKHPVEMIELRLTWGVVGDAHAGDWHRQISLLAWESISRAVARGLDVGPGSFAENVTTDGIDLPSLPAGTRLSIGPAIVEVTQIGKAPHEYDVIHELVGDSVIPSEGIFARVLKGGTDLSGPSMS